jgi:hypothetical protein
MAVNRPIGSVTVTGHEARVKVDDGPLDRRWRNLARLVWERAHGPIPAGMVVCRRNGEVADCRLENLELISRAESARRTMAANPDMPAVRSRAGRASGWQVARVRRARKCAGVRKQLAAALAGLCPECRASLGPWWERIIKGCRVEAEYRGLTKD